MRMGVCPRVQNSVGGVAHSYFPATHGPVLSSSNTLHSSVEWEGRGSICQIKEKCVTCQVPHGFYIMEAGLGPAVSHFISLIPKPLEEETGLQNRGVKLLLLG